MIRQTAEYALRAVVYLAENPGKCLPAQQIAQATQVPPGYLAKILQSLSRAKLVHAQRGLNGGYRLLRPPADISLFEVVSTVSVFERIESCPLSLKSHEHELCALHRKLDDALALVEESFRSTSLQDLLSGDSTNTFDDLSPLPESVND